MLQFVCKDIDRENTGVDCKIVLVESLLQVSLDSFFQIKICFIQIGDFGLLRTT